ncbi:Sorting nexin-13 [Echinococcus granulosus]|uniref:Sorting nexin-13 n=1 Tax=Echinococcus granulosus TaxID=6210 RepID=W6U7H4_ECHGR|nr:Sorting nexin-13 [Echinococcus granulosus]EUB57183.1 Sorting nexin-13 [Echinococcus granulosus]
MIEDRRVINDCLAAAESSTDSADVHSSGGSSSVVLIPCTLSLIQICQLFIFTPPISILGEEWSPFCMFCNLPASQPWSQVVTSVSKSTHALLKAKSDLKNMRDSLKAMFHSQMSRLDDFIKQATMELKDACSKSVDRSTANLNALIAERQNELATLKDRQDESSKDDSSTSNASTCKQIFVGGILPKTNCMELRKYFSHYGTVEHAYISPYKLFGSVTFESEESVRKAISQPEHFICGRRVTVEEYIPKKSLPVLEPQPYKKESPSTHPWEAQKVFIGGISTESTIATVRSALSRLGPIEKIEMVPQQGFAIVVFKEPETAKLAISTRWYTVDGKRVEMLPYVPDKKTRDALARVTSSPQLMRQITPTPVLPPEKQTTVFVGGISWETTVDSLKSALSKLGPVQKVTLPPTRGFAIVVFAHPETAESAIATHWHLIDNKKVELLPFIPNRATKLKTLDSGVANSNARKLIIRGLDEGTTYTALRNYFINYGAIDYVSATDTGSWVLFKNAESVDLVLSTQPHLIRGKKVEDFRPLHSRAKYNYAISGCHELDVVLNQILEYIIDDYVRCWYAQLTSESEFPGQLHAAMAQLAGEVAKRAQRIDWVPFMIEGIPNMVIEHLRIHRRSLERRSLSNAEDPLKLFFDEEYEMEKPICREDICTSRAKELNHLRRVTDVFLFAIMPEDDYRIVAVRYLIKEILVNGVLLPAVNILADSDFVNQSIIKLCNESAFASPYFIQSLRMSTREDELQTVKERIEIFAAKLRGRDSGGDDGSTTPNDRNSCHTEFIPIQTSLFQAEGNSGRGRNCVRVSPQQSFCAEHLGDTVYRATNLCESDSPEAMVTTIHAGVLINFFEPKLLYRHRKKAELLVPFCLFFMPIDAMVKAQLNSLNFLENICDSQITEIKRGPSRMPGHLMDAMASGADVLSHTMVDFTFDDVMANNIAVSNFLEFLTSINEQSLLSLYLNCVAYRVNSEELMSSITSSTTDATTAPSTTVSNVISDEGDEFGNALGWNESTEQVERLEVEQHVMSAQDRETMEGIRAFGVSMCNLVMKILPQVPEATVQQCLRSLTTPLESIDPTVFVDVEEELIRLLSSEQCFGAFKKSPFYARAVEELEVSDLTESPRRFAANNGEEVPDTTCSSSISSSSSPILSRAASSAVFSASSNSSQGAQSQFYSSSSPSSFYADSYSVNVLSGEMVRDGYVVYTLEVTYLSSVSGRRSVWRTYRRYSQFDDLHSCIIEQCGRIPTLKLPSKKSFSNISLEFIEKRRLELDEYLKVLCSIDASGKYPKLHPILTSFLQPEKWERRKALHPGVSSLMNPLKAMGSAIISVPDSLFDGFSKMISRRQPSDRSDVNGNAQTTTAATSSTNSRFSTSSDTYTSNLFILDQTDSDNIPFRLLFMLVDEVFSLQRKTQLFRRGALTILRNIVQTFFGDIMNRRIVEKAKHLISAKKIATYAEMFRDVVWPNGSQVNGRSGNGDTEEPPIRDEAMKLRTRVLCRAVMFGSVAEELASYLGVETTREGVQRVFDLLQQPCLNRRLVHCLLEGVTRLLLPEYADQLNDIYAQDNCRST